MRFFASFALLAALCAAVCTPARAQFDGSVVTPSDPAGAMQTARGLVAAGKLDEAIGRLRFYVRVHPSEIGPERLLGDLYFRRSNLSMSEITYTHILQYSPNDKETHNRLGTVYAVQNRIDDAIREFNRSLPGTASVEDLVHMHMRRGDFAAYKHELEFAAEQNPLDAEAQMELGILYQTIGQDEVAERLFRHALALQKHSLIALNGLGVTLQDERRYTDALEVFEQCLQIDPANYACKTNLGADYLHQSQWALADTTLKDAHKMFPERSEALVDLGYLADEQGDWKRAVNFYVQATDVDPFEADAYLNLGATYQEHNLSELAQAALVKGLSIAPEDGRLHFALGELYTRQGNALLAASQYRAAAVAQNLDESYRQAAKARLTSALMHTPKPAVKP